MKPIFPKTRRTIVQVALLTITRIGVVGALTCGNPVLSAPAPILATADAWSYADIADVFLDAPIVLTVRVTEAIAVNDSSSAQTSKMTNRFYLAGDVVSLIRGSGGIAPRVAWLADVPLDGKRKAPRLQKAQFILAGLPVTGRPGELQLAARDAMVAWSGPLETRVRAAITDRLAPNAPPRITGIASAFHSSGTLPGEGETQLFLTTSSAKPVSINVLRRPGIDPQWAVALGEIIDEAARPPARDTLGWYQLACFLPRELPLAAVGELASGDAAAAREDYRFVLQSLGACTHMRPQP